MMSYRGIVGLPDLDFSTLAASRRQPTGPLNRRRSQRNESGRQSPLNGARGGSPSNDYELPPFIGILIRQLVHTPADENGLKYFITNVGALHEAAFSPKCPILGTGHHFAVYASPFESSDGEFRAHDGRAFNNQIYCMKAPNFTSGGASTTGPEKDAFCKEYYDTVLQEVRVLLHPDLRSHDNIIGLFGLDFQEDYDDCTIAWPVLVMENAEYGTLDTFQQDVNHDADLARLLLLDVAHGIQALHQCNIIHGDVKSENVLICRHKLRPYVARLSDFGLSLINPDPEREDHYLPGGTFLWRAPDFDCAMSVEGLRQTDIYSFGLTVWRVLVRNPNPYSLISPSAMGLDYNASLSDVVSHAKDHFAFTKFVLQTLEMAGADPILSLRIIESTLGKDPKSRNLIGAISALASGRDNVMPKIQPDEIYWAMEEPAEIMEQLLERFPASLVPFRVKASILHSLIKDLECIFNSSQDIALAAGWLLFQFAASPLFGVFKKNADGCCSILLKLCELKSLYAQAIIIRYHQVHRKILSRSVPEWLEVTAMKGSYFAMEGLCEKYPERYQQLMSGPLDFESPSTDFDGDEVDLVTCCRAGNYELCTMLLQAGTPAFPQEGKVSALHWLISFHEEKEINNLVDLLLKNGAVLDAWEGEDDDFVLGRFHGTPLHWAIWHRNIPAVRALTKVETRPDVKQIGRAISIAAGMLFSDVLEILKSWVLSLRDFELGGVDWYTALLWAVDQGSFWLARFLRHANDDQVQAFECTMDIISTFYRPPEEDFRKIFISGISNNDPKLIRYMYKAFDLRKQQDLLYNDRNDISLTALVMGSVEVIEVFIEKGVISSQSEHGVEKWTPLQLCCLSRKRDPALAKRLLDIGCPVDGVGGTEKSIWTPFLIAVSLGLFDIAVMFLEHGANKDRLLGWLGGSTVTMNLLQTWPDIPLSRLKFLLEEIPRLGFGHVTFWGWPGAGGNLLYALSMNHWASYTAGYRLGETAKYILSELADKSCLNIIDKLGATALRMACAGGNKEVIAALIDAGQDVNLSLGFSPLKNAREWLTTCEKREKKACNGKSGSEIRLARTLRVRAEETIELLLRHGAIDRGNFEAMANTRQFLESGQWQKPSFETVLEMFSGVIDSSPMVKAGSTPLHPTSKEELRAYHGKKSWTQEFLGNLGRGWDRTRGGQGLRQPPTPRFQSHNCLPWRSENCVCSTQSSSVMGQRAPQAFRPVSNWQNIHSAARDLPGHIAPMPPLTRQWQSLNPGSFPNGDTTYRSNTRAVLAQQTTSIPPQFNGMPPSLPITQQWHPSTPTTFTPENTVSTRAYHNVPRQPIYSGPPAPRDVKAVVERIQHLLLHYFCEGGGGQATIEKRREYAVGVLREQFQSHVRLNTPHFNTENCEEFSKIENAVNNCLEVLHISGIMLVPELSDDGRELILYVVSDQDVPFEGITMVDLESPYEV